MHLSLETDIDDDEVLQELEPGTTLIILAN